MILTTRHEPPTAHPFAHACAAMLVTLLVGCHRDAPITRHGAAHDASARIEVTDVRLVPIDAGSDTVMALRTDAQMDATPDASDGATTVSVALGTPIRIVRDTSFVRARFQVRVDGVDHPDPAVRAAIAAQLHAWLSDAAQQFESNARRSLRCDCTLALTSLVSFVCIAASESHAYPDERGMIETSPRRLYRTFVWTIDGSDLRAVRNGDVVDEDDAGLSIAACRRRGRFARRSQEECDRVTDTYVAVEPRGLIVVYRLADAGSEVERVLLTWRDLGRAVHRRGPLARVPHALDHASEPSRAFRDDEIAR